MVLAGAEGCEAGTPGSAAPPNDAPGAEAPVQQGSDVSAVEGTPLAAEPVFDSEAAALNKRLRLDVVNCIGSSVIQIAPGVYDVEVQLDEPDARGVWVKVVVGEANVKSGFMQGTSGRVSVDVAGGSLYDRATLTTFSPFGKDMWVKDECESVSIVDQP